MSAYFGREVNQADGARAAVNPPQGGGNIAFPGSSDGVPKGDPPMKRLVLTGVATATVTLFGWVTPLQAAPITYTETAMASGALNGTSFSNRVVTITFFGDTLNVAPFGNGCALCLVNLVSTATVNVSGVGTDTFKDPTGIIGFPFLSPDLGGMAGVAMVDAAPQTSGLLLIATIDNAFVGYDLASAIGPIQGLTGTPDNAITYSTTLGTFQWNPYPDTSTFTAAVAPVPEPATLTLTALGLGGVLTRYCRRRSAS
jgi:hypothetical protein